MTETEQTTRRDFGDTSLTIDQTTRLYRAEIADLAATYEAIQTLHDWDEDEGPEPVQDCIDRIEGESLSINALPDAEEWLHAAVDGHEWIIYTWKARLVAIASPKDADELQEEVGVTPETPEEIAYATMLIDVMEEASA
jgi:hypothetical protein